MYQATYGAKTEDLPAIIAAQQAKWGDEDYKARFAPIAANLVPGAKAIVPVDLGGGKIALEVEYGDGRPNGVITDNRKSMEEDPNDRITQIDAADFYTRIVPAIETFTSPSVKNPYLRNVFLQQAMAASPTDMPETTEIGDTAAEIAKGKGGQQGADAFQAGVAARRFGNGEIDLPPEAQAELEGFKKSFPDYFMMGFNRLHANPEQTVGSQFNKAESSGELDGSTAFQRDGYKLGGIAGQATSIMDGSHPLARFTPQGIIANDIAPAVKGYLSDVKGYFTDEKQPSASPQKPVEPSKPATANAPFENLVEQNPARATKKPNPETDPAAAIQQRTDAAASGDKVTVNRQKVTETQFKRSPSKVIESPEKRADIAASMVQQGFWSQEQAMNFVQTGYMSFQAMQMANYPEELKIRTMEASARMYEQKAKLDKQQREDWDKSADNVRKMLKESFQMAMPDGKAQAQYSWMPAALEDAFGFHGFSTDVEYDNFGNPIASRYSPVKTERFLRTNPWKDSSFFNAMASMARNNPELPRSSIAALTVAAAMRHNTDLFANADDMDSLGKMLIGMGSKATPGDLDSALGILEYARLANPDFSPARINGDMLSVYYSNVQKAIEENKAQDRPFNPDIVYRYATHKTLESLGIPVPQRPAQGQR